jgi:hypothetical protein
MLAHERGGQRLPAKKPSKKLGLDVSTKRVKTSSAILYISTIVIDCIGLGW